MKSTVLGVDIGGSHIKAAPVDTADGELISPPKRVVTPSPATPSAVVDVGVSADFDRYSRYLHTRTTVVPAKMANEAGIVGAALLGRATHAGAAPDQR